MNFNGYTYASENYFLSYQSAASHIKNSNFQNFSYKISHTHHRGQRRYLILFYFTYIYILTSLHIKIKQNFVMSYDSQRLLLYASKNRIKKKHSHFAHRLIFLSPFPKIRTCRLFKNIFTIIFIITFSIYQQTFKESASLN